MYFLADSTTTSPRQNETAAVSVGVVQHTGQCVEERRRADAPACLDDEGLLQS